MEAVYRPIDNPQTVLLQFLLFHSILESIEPLLAKDSG